MLFHSSDLRMKIRKEIVKLSKLPDNIKEYDDYIICKYTKSGISISFYSDHIILIESDKQEKLTYSDINYINTLVNLYESESAL